MKRLIVLSLLAALGAGSVAADALRFAGVLGNSGEQGATLVRFGEKPASGIGVIHDAHGSLWDRGGAGVLNRYALDGRLITTYTIAPTGARGERDKIIVLGDKALLKLGKKLYTLPLDAPSGSSPTALPVEATRISFNAHDGWVAAALDKAVFLVNAAGEKRDLTVLDAPVEELDQGPDGAIYVQLSGKMWRIDPVPPAGRSEAGPSPGERPQWLDGHWYGSTWHGTIRRFAADFSPAPGVVLGGASGSFIGYVEGNTDIENATGLAKLGRGLFAVSGNSGVMHLLSWNTTDSRFQIIRRIGSVPELSALAIDGTGRVWADGGVWLENSGPATPLRHCVPAIEAFGSTTLANGVVVTPGFRWGKPAVYHGQLDGPARLSGGVDELRKTSVASAVATADKRATLLVVDAAGRGFSYAVDANGKPSGAASEVVLKATGTLKAITSLASPAPDTLVAAADGWLVEFAWKDKAWTETGRWNTWGHGLAERFGDRVFVAAASGRLWVSDTLRHRALGFDAKTRGLLATFGQDQKAGDDLASLRSPTLISAFGDRLAIFDAGNQRIVRLDRVAD